MMFTIGTEFKFVFISSDLKEHRSIDIGKLRMSDLIEVAPVIKNGKVVFDCGETITSLTPLPSYIDEFVANWNAYMEKARPVLRRLLENETPELWMELAAIKV